MVEDRIEYSIEISTQESAEIRELIDKIDSADKKFKSIKSDRIGRQIFESEGAPIQDEREGPIGPIFRGEEEPESISQISRPGRGKQAYQRQDIFKNLQNKVDDLEKKDNTILEELGQLGPVLVSGGVAGVGNKLFSLIKPLIPFIAESLITLGLTETIMNELLKPGGLFDRRFKLIIEKLVNKLMDRQLQSEIRQGFRQVYISSYISPKGARKGQIGSNLGGISRGQFIYDDKLEKLSKGLYN